MSLYEKQNLTIMERKYINLKQIVKNVLVCLFVISCNGQNKTIEKSKEEGMNFIGKKFIIDKNNKGDGLFRSNNLDQLLKIKNEIYKQGKSFVNIDEEYHLVTINIMNLELNEIKETYILPFNRDVLSDTLKIGTNLVIDCNVIIEKNNNGRAFCLRSVKGNKLQSIYTLDKKNKIVKMPLNTALRPSDVINLDDRE